MTSDDELMARVASGEEAAFAEVLARHEVTVRRVCTLLVGSAGDEFAQEVFLKLWLERQRYEPRGQLRAYLCTIARRRCISELRRRKVFRFFQKQHTPTHFDPRNSGDIVKALQTLPEDLRLPMHLRFVEDLDYSEIATIIGFTESAARSRIHHGVKALSKVIQ